MRTLIVEDDIASRKYLYKLLSKYGECDMVADGLEALDAYLLALKENKPYHLICLDIILPKVDGNKVLKAIRDFETLKGLLPEKRTKVIMITALAETKSVQDAIGIGCDAYLSKPIDSVKLIELLREMKLITDIEE